MSRAKDLIFTGRQVGADEALRIGLADRVVPPDEVLDEALALAAELAAGPARGTGGGQAASSTTASRSRWPTASRSSVAAFVSVSHTEDAALGVASFLEHGPGPGARFVGR